MSLEQTEDRPVHFPADPQKFIFDAEVANVFDDMAVRAIPNFLAAHEAHTSMCFPWLSIHGVSVMDIGASRGAFFREIQRQHPEKVENGDITLHAVDNSEQMCNYLRQDFPKADVQQVDVTSSEFLNDSRTYDIVCANYILQFVPEHLQTQVLARVFKMVRQGGVLIFGHKSMHHGESGDLSHEQYIKFRLANGYTMEEITAKTRALRGSMFPMKHGRLMSSVRTHFSDVSETFRFMMFSTFFAIK